MIKNLKLAGSKIEIQVLSLTIILYLFRTPIPFLKFPFLILFSVLTIYLLIKLRHRLYINSLEYFRSYYLLLLLASILLLSFLFSDKIYLAIFKDLLNTVILLSFLYLMNLIIINDDDKNIFLSSISKFIIIIAVFISFLRFIDLFKISYFFTTEYVGQAHYFVENKAVSIDYNFALLPVFFALVIILYSLAFENSTRLKKIISNIFLVLLTSSIILSGSRRGLLVLTSFLLFLILCQLFSIFTKNQIIRKLNSSTRYFLTFIFVFWVGFGHFALKASYDVKNNILKSIGCKNVAAARGEIAFIIFRYYSAIDPTITFHNVYDLIWKPVFNPHDPDSGWGTRVHKTVFPLEGTNVEILPRGSKGYYLDKGTNADFVDGRAFSATWLTEYNVKAGQKLHASVYCFISEDCDVSSTMICSLGSMGNPGAVYDMNRRGSWQKLDFSVDCVDGHANILLFFSKDNVADFSTMKGYIIFAYPEFGIVDLNEMSLNQTDKLSGVDFLSHYHPVTKAGIFNSFPHLFIPVFAFQNQDTDPVRRMISDFIAEDTTYHGYSSQLNIDTLSNSFVSGRTARWQFALEIFKKEYNIRQKIIGGGFNFLNWYGSYFFHDNKTSDHPHNPFLSILLYSGIMGLIIYCLLLVRVVRFYLKNIKTYFLLSLFFLITLFFSFFSGGSPFDPPFMGFFFILPFFLDRYKKSSGNK